MTGYTVLVVCLVASAALPTMQLKFGPRPPFQYYSKVDWGGRPEAGGQDLDLPVPYVVIHHTYSPRICYTTPDCMQAMRSMQNYHMDFQGWTDIGYNYAVGGDGAVYEGRGWHRVGAHAVGYNVQSIGIVFIGDFVSDLPPPRQAEAAKNLIAALVASGVVSPTYCLIGHRQVSATECPGESLFTDITTWPRFIHYPNSEQCK